MLLWRGLGKRTASDGAHDAPRTIDDALIMLRLALAENAQDTTMSRALAPLKTVCRIARADGMPPEHLIVRLKSTMDEVPGLHPHAIDEHRMRDRLVSIAIDAYFGE